MDSIQDYDLVVLLEDRAATHKTTHQPILLRRGQVGTVLMSFEGVAFLVDFTDSQGNTFAMESIEADRLLRLIYEPMAIAA
ncbi:MAG TPA: DUF4926 domain-containing protein [Oscillatoriales cyanobacterium M59_W2019_021]|nr:DUF4926 domain-containing protein [Oscillatoriales cyanobacterium M4454_W2019_049]HIK53534.1 DUF4926 domain-containing protein [Oscillatoriales cyanobacterium M59_W2019_021]